MRRGHNGYTDFGEGAGRSPQPVLRAVVRVSTPGEPGAVSALIDTGAPVTIVGRSFFELCRDAVDTGTTMVLRLGGSTSVVPLHRITLEARPPYGARGAEPIAWTSLVAVLDPWPHLGTAIMLGQIGFLDTFTVTFGLDGFALEPAAVFRDRFPLDDPESR